MKFIVLMRHGHADDHATDYLRTLTAHGQQAAIRAGRELATMQPPIQRIISSSAVRASRTAELVADQMQTATAIESRRDLYLAEPSECVAALRVLPDDVCCALLVGHNPGLSIVVRAWTHHSVNLAPAEYVQASRNVERWSDLR